MANFDESFAAIYNAAAQYILNPESNPTVVSVVQPFVDTFFPEVKENRDFFELRKQTLALMRKIGRSHTVSILSFLRTLEMAINQISFTDCMYVKLEFYLTNYIKDNPRTYWLTHAEKLFVDISTARNDLVALKAIVLRCCNNNLVGYFRNSPNLKPELEAIIKLIPEDPSAIAEWEIIPRYSDNPVPADRREYIQSTITDNTPRDELIAMIAHLMAANEKLSWEIAILERKTQYLPAHEAPRTPTREQTVEDGFLVVGLPLPKPPFH